MLRNKTVAVIGGDMRQFTIYEQLILQNNKASMYAFEKHKLSSHIEAPELSKKNLAGADYIILPLLATNGGKLNAPFSDINITEEELIPILPKKGKVFGGKLSESFLSCAEAAGLEVHDYMNREEFAVLNAVPTAEGAISIAIEKMPGILCQSPVLITGFGRIGKVLSQRLLYMGAKVTVSARKARDIAWISAYGMTPIKTGELIHHEMNFDLIVNTIPEMIFDRKLLSKVKNGCVIIDLASLPGGVDFAAAAEMGLVVEHALSLPGKVAPGSAGKIILNTIENIIDETREVNT